VLSTGGNESLIAIQAASIVFALPVAILLCFLVQSITLFCQATVDSDIHDYVFIKQPEFDMPVYGGIYIVMEYLVSLGHVNPARVELGMHCATFAQLVEFIKGVVVPFISLNQILSVQDLPTESKDEFSRSHASCRMLLGLVGMPRCVWRISRIEGCLLDTIFHRWWHYRYCTIRILWRT
jgi:hypothetical protein